MTRDRKLGCEDLQSDYTQAAPFLALLHQKKTKQGSSKDLQLCNVNFKGWFHQKQKLRLQQHKMGIYSLAGSPLRLYSVNPVFSLGPKPRWQHESRHDSLTSLSGCLHSNQSSTVTEWLFLPGKGPPIHELSVHLRLQKSGHDTG